MDDRNVDIPDVWPDLVIGVPSRMFPTTAAGTGSGSDLQTSSLVTQDAMVDCVNAWIHTNDFYLINVINWINGRISKKKNDDTLYPTMFCTLTSLNIIVHNLSNVTEYIQIHPRLWPSIIYLVVVRSSWIKWPGPSFKTIRKRESSCCNLKLVAGFYRLGWSIGQRQCQVPEQTQSILNQQFRKVSDIVK